MIRWWNRSARPACTLSEITELAAWVPADMWSIALGFAAMSSFASDAVDTAAVPTMTLGSIGEVILEGAAHGWLSIKISIGIRYLTGPGCVLTGRWMCSGNKLFVVF
ncbi:hypothetical protein PG999_000111 [Apiospora kogelbergensis]|uniref:Uncharacterized protein n=1 Tax=Apiospora kogelbergensis TaxID=1337665 RepID=A0AAW0RAS8_9PEZI